MDDICEAVSTEISYPWLVFSHGIHTQKQTFYSILNDHYYTKFIPKMQSKDICFSDHGWVLLHDYIFNKYSLLNMITMDEDIQLPHLPDPVMVYNCKLFTSSPSDPNCRIMFIDGYSERCIMSCHICNDDHFVKHYFKIVGDDDNDDFLSFAIYMNGKIYGLTLPYYGLVIADHHDMSIIMNSSSSSTTIRFHKLIQDNELSLPRKTLPAFQTTNYLTECNEDLLLISVTFFAHLENVTGIRLFRADLSIKAWTEVKSIGTHHAIFPDKTRAFSFSRCGADIKGNCIYFIEKEDRSLYTYSLEDQSITMTLPCHLSATVTTSESNDSLWISIPLDTNKKNLTT